MGLGRKITTIGIVLGLVVGVGLPASAEPRARPTGGARPDTVMLITGDQVILWDGNALNPSKAVTVRPATGRGGMNLRTLPHRGHHYAIPADAARSVANGQLDLRLFDVTSAIEYGYGDNSRGNLPLPVTDRRGIQRGSRHL